MAPPPRAASRRREARVVAAYVGLGSNLGASEAILEAAVAALGHLPRTMVTARSSLYRSAPVDAGGPDFINAVVALDTDLAARELLRALNAIEAAHGRRRPARNAPRTLDLDLLLYGDERIDDHDLVVPHPRLHQRAFVLQPLTEIVPDLDLPGLGEAALLLPALAGQRVTRL